jgi:hypothetical protein
MLAAFTTQNRDAPRRWAMGRTTEKFDEQLFAIKLLELPPLPRIDGSFFPTNAAIDSYPVSLRKRLEGIDRICREIWRGETVTPEFVREVLTRKVTIQIDIAEGESVTRSIATDLERWGSAWAYLAKEVGELRSEFANRYEREIKGLVPVEQTPSASLHGCLKTRKRMGQDGESYSRPMRTFHRRCAQGRPSSF